MTTSFQFLTILNMRSTFEYHRLPSSLKRLPEKIFYQFDCTRLYMQWMLAIERIIQNWWFVFCCLQNSKLVSFLFVVTQASDSPNVRQSADDWSQVPPLRWICLYIVMSNRNVLTIERETSYLNRYLLFTHKTGCLFNSRVW